MSRCLLESVSRPVLAGLVGYLQAGGCLTTKRFSFFRHSVYFAFAVILSLFIDAQNAFADCVSPAGVEGNVVYNDDYNVVQFCDSTNWIRMGGAGDTRIGTLTASKWCAVNVGGTAIDCTQDAPAASAGSDTQVIFNDGGSTLAGAAQFLWDKTNNRLGIGSASAPTQTLDVTGTASVNKINLKLVSGAAAPIGASVAGGSASHVQFNNGSGLAGDSNLVWDDTNKRLGIGTASPNNPLTVNGSVVAGPGALAGPAYMFYPTGTYGATGLYAPAANTIGFVTTGGERMRIDASGNVGIGASTMSYGKLVVQKAGVDVISGVGGQIEVRSSGTSDDAVIGFHVPGAVGINVGLDATDNRFKLAGWSMAGGTGVYLAMNTTSWGSLSDGRVKTNVQEMSVLDKLADYRTVSFNWKTSGKHDIGVIAQEVYKIFPETVDVGANTDAEASEDSKGLWGVRYDKFGVLALEAAKELKADNDTQDAEIRELREEIKALRSAIH